MEEKSGFFRSRFLAMAHEGGTYTKKYKLI